MRYKFIFLLGICFFALAVPGQAQALTLQEAVDVALTNNVQILIEKKKVEEAKSGMQEAFAGYLPTVDLKGNYTHLGEVPSVSFGSTQIQTGQQDTTSFTLSLTQPVYTGGKLSLANKQAGFNYQRANRSLHRTENEVIFQVKQSFYSTLLAKENLQIKEKALGKAEAHLEVVESFYRSGRASRLDLLRARVEVANIKPEVIKAKNEVNLARERLANLLSTSSSSLSIEGEFVFEPVDVSLKEAIQKGLSARSDLEALQVQKDMAEVSLRIAKANALPSLSLIGNYQYATAEVGWEDEWNVNLVMSFPLFNARNKASVEQKKSQLRQAELAIKKLEEAIKMEIKKAFLDMEAARESVLAQEKNIDQAQEALSIAEARYKNGAITQLELLDAQLALTQARLGYTSAMYDYNMAKAALVKAVGGRL